MIKNKYPLLVFVAIISLFFTCERDDICAETTETTPQLIIEFYDISDDEALKTVPSLSVAGIDESGNLLTNIIQSSSTNTVTVPLNFTAEGQLTSSQFSLTQNDFENSTTVNQDIINISYIPNFEYVSRACGYKSIFENLSMTIVSDSDNWIISQDIIVSTVEDENTVHIHILH